MLGVSLLYDVNYLCWPIASPDDVTEVLAADSCSDQG